jgi:hypothetical protein
MDNSSRRPPQTAGPGIKDLQGRDLTLEANECTCKSNQQLCSAAQAGHGPLSSRDAETQKCSDAVMQKCKDAKTRKCNDAAKQSYVGTGTNLSFVMRPSQGSLVGSVGGRHTAQAWWAVPPAILPAPMHARYCAQCTYLLDVGSKHYCRQVVNTVVGW